MRRAGRTNAPTRLSNGQRIRAYRRRHPRPYRAMSSGLIGIVRSAWDLLLLSRLATRNDDAPAFVPWISGLARIASW